MVKSEQKLLRVSCGGDESDKTLNLHIICFEIWIPTLYMSVSKGGHYNPEKAVAFAFSGADLIDQSCGITTAPSSPK